MTLVMGPEVGGEQGAEVMRGQTGEARHRAKAWEQTSGGRGGRALKGLCSGH